MIMLPIGGPIIFETERKAAAAVANVVANKIKGWLNRK